MLANFQIGGGPASLILLHGFLGSGRNLTTLAKRLSEKFPHLTLTVMDLTGHGASPALPKDASLTTLAEDVLATAKSLSLPESFGVIGHSLGGRVALRLSGLSLESVSKVAILDISPAPLHMAQGETQRVTEVLLKAPESAPTREPFRGYLREEGLPDALSNWLLMNLIVVEGEYRWRIERGALAALLQKVNVEDLWQDAAQIAKKGALFCIRGGASSYVSQEDAVRLSQLGAKVETIEGAGHFIHAEALEALLSSLDAFVAF